RASAWIDKVDGYLKGKGVPIALTDLVFGVCPLDLPTPDDNPFIGSWPPRVIPGALDALRRVDLSDADHDTAETVAQIRDWLETPASDPDEGLIGVLS